MTTKRLQAWNVTPPNAVPADGEQFGEFEAVSRGGCGYYNFRCLKAGHPKQLLLQYARRQRKQGITLRCQECKAQ